MRTGRPVSKTTSVLLMMSYLLPSAPIQYANSQGHAIGRGDTKRPAVLVKEARNDRRAGARAVEAELGSRGIAIDAGEQRAVRAVVPGTLLAGQVGDRDDRRPLGREDRDAPDGNLGRVGGLARDRVAVVEDHLVGPDAQRVGGVVGRRRTHERHVDEAVHRNLASRVGDGALVVIGGHEAHVVDARLPSRVEDEVGTGLVGEVHDGCHVSVLVALGVTPAGELVAVEGEEVLGQSTRSIIGEERRGHRTGGIGGTGGEAHGVDDRRPVRIERRITGGHREGGRRSIDGKTLHRLGPAIEHVARANEGVGRGEVDRGVGGEVIGDGVAVVVVSADRHGNVDRAAIGRKRELEGVHRPVRVERDDAALSTGEVLDRCAVGDKQAGAIGAVVQPAKS